MNYEIWLIHGIMHPETGKVASIETLQVQDNK